MRVDYVNESRLSGRRWFVLRRRSQVADDLLQLVLVLLQPIYCFGRSLGLCRRGVLLLDELQGLENVGADRLHQADEGVIVVRARSCCELRAKPGVLTCHQGVPPFHLALTLIGHSSRVGVCMYSRLTGHSSRVGVQSCGAMF